MTEGKTITLKPPANSNKGHGTKSTILRPGRFLMFGITMICLLVVADQYSKWAVIETLLRENGHVPDFISWFTTQDKITFLAPGQDVFRTIAVLPFFNLVMVWNQGVSFGMLQSGDPRAAFALIGLSLVISMLLFVWLALADSRRVAWGIALIIGGAIGNVIDRVRFGAVADFIDLHIGGYHWPAFNLADSAIVLGGIILLIDSFFGHKEPS